MIDVHSHVLPHMDDGSRSTQESLSMLESSAAQGIRCMVATPHFYAEENDPERFLQRREACAERLRNSWKPGLPQLLLGAEVRYFEGVGQVKEIADLRIEGTQVLLLEMPFCAWSERMLADVWELNRRPDMTVLLAHIERYMRWQGSGVWDELLSWGVQLQCNAEFFLNWRTKRKAIEMLNRGQIHFIGSDCHNMDTRPPRLGEALKRLNESQILSLRENIDRYFSLREE